MLKKLLSFTALCAFAMSASAQTSQKPSSDKVNACVTISIVKYKTRCFGECNGLANANATGGSGNYVYSWSNGGQSSDGINLCATTYTLTVTDVGNSCTATTVVTIIDSPQLTMTPTVNSTSCGFNNGSVFPNTTGGTGAYTYLWSNTSTATSLSNLSPNTYSVTVKDANQCTATYAAAVLSSLPITVQTTAVDASCSASNGSATANVTDGIPNYIYSWSVGGGGVTSSTSNTKNNLSAGIYTVTVTDGMGCIGTSVVSVGNISGPSISSVTTTNSICGNANGAAIVNAAGGTGMHTYSWTNGSTSKTNNNLTPGTYDVTVTDANGCKDTYPVTVGNTVNLNLTTSSSAEACGKSNGSAAVLASGGSPDYTYTWSNGQSGITTSSVDINNGLSFGTYTVTVTDGLGCVVSATTNVINVAGPSASVGSVVDETCGNSNGSANVIGSGGTGALTYSWSNSVTTPTALNLAAATYTVDVIDANSCVATVFVTVQNSPDLSIQIISTPENCATANGTANVSTPGGTPSYTYEWSDGTNNISASKNDNIGGLAAAIYTVTVTDANGCSDSKPFAVAAVGPVLSIGTVFNETCGLANGSADVIASGGVGTFTYNWSSGSTSVTAIGLSANMYTVTVSDMNGCSGTKNVTITNTPGLSVTVTSTINETCGNSNGSAFVSVTGGTPGYNFTWSSGSMSATATGLAANVYTVTVSDVNACSGTTVATIINAVPVITVTSNVPEICGSGNGSTSVSVSGGTPTYTYSWSSGSTSATANNLIAATYTLTVSDAAACTSYTTVTINCIVGIKEGTWKNSVSVSPNPSRGIFVIEMTIKQSSPIEITLVNVLGEQVAVLDKIQQTGIYKKQIDIENMPAGIYFLNIQSSEERYLGKIIKR